MSFPTRGIVSLFHFRRLVDVQSITLCLICFLRMPDGVEHLFISYLLAIWMPSFVNCSSSLFLKTGLSVSFLLICFCLYSGIRPLLVTWITNNFSHFVAYHSILSMVFFDECKLLILMKPNLSFVFFIVQYFFILLKDLCLLRSHKDVILYHLLDVFLFYLSHFDLHPLEIDVCRV